MLRAIHPWGMRQSPSCSPVWHRAGTGEGGRWDLLPQGNKGPASLKARQRGLLTCLHLPHLDLPVVEPGGQDQAGEPQGTGRIRVPILSCWPGTEGQAPHDLPTLQSLLLGCPTAPGLCFASPALAFRGFAAAGGRQGWVVCSPWDPPPQLHAPSSPHTGQPLGSVQAGQ